MLEDICIPNACIGLYFHLENQQVVYWKDIEQIGSILSKKTVKESMFTTWMDSNQRYSQGRDLTYAQYLSKFVYVARQRCWQPRKQGYTIDRLIWVPCSTEDLFYLRICKFYDMKCLICLCVMSSQIPRSDLREKALVYVLLPWFYLFGLA